MLTVLNKLCVVIVKMIKHSTMVRGFFAVPGGC